MMAPDLPAMIIDSFAGGGGASTGIEMALGRSPDVAINHSAKALALHAANHPDTLHLDSNIWDVKPTEVTRGRKVGLLWASPDCKHFSKAKGGAPRDRNIRDLAWVVVDWAEQVKPDVIAMENVEEFVTWGPLGNDGQPLREFTGQTFDLWVARLKKAGYKVQWRELRACDYGAPTIRKRWFLVARRDGRPITWPKPTHGDPKSDAVRKGRLKPWRTAAECIDWSVPCPSIFATAPEIMEQHGLRAIRPLAANTLARIARGMKRYVIDADRPFLVNLTHGARCEDAGEPFRTITGAHRGEKAVVVPSIVGCGGRAGQSRTRGGDEPLATMTAKADACLATAHLLALKGTARRAMPLDAPHPTVLAGGGHSALIAPTLANVANGKTTGRGPNAWPVDDPLRTITAANGHALIAPSLTRFNGGATGQDLRDPMATVTANSWIKKPGGAAPLGIIAPVLTYAQQGGGNRPVTEPHHTICASRKDQNSVLLPYLASIAHGDSGGRREYPLTDPLGTITVGGIQHAVVAPHLMTMRNSGKPFNGADEPAHTVTAGGAGLTSVAAFLAQHHTGATGHDARDPMSTIAATGSHQNPVAAFFAKYYGAGTGAGMDEPCHTITVNDRFGHVQADLQAPPFTEGHAPRACAVADFLRAHGAWDGGEFVTLTIDGAQFIVVDIGMRMLTPRELFNAQGFPPDYVIEGVWDGIDTPDPVFRPFAKDVQVSCCGNSVCPDLARAIISENCNHLKSTTTITAIASP
jgi:DNA (cytosine-5)-methyltransferase 1